MIGADPPGELEHSLLRRGSAGFRCRSCPPEKLAGFEGFALEGELVSRPATDAAGWPMTAAPVAVMATSPPTRTLQPMNRRITQTRLVGARLAQGRGSRAGIVGGTALERVRFETLVTGVEDIDRPEDGLGCGQHGDDRCGRLDVAGEQERDFGLDPQMMNRSKRIGSP